jgi:hypothetical protein
MFVQETTISYIYPCRRATAAGARRRHGGRETAARFVRQNPWSEMLIVNAITPRTLNKVGMLTSAVARPSRRLRAA